MLDVYYLSYLSVLIVMRARNNLITQLIRVTWNCGFEVHTVFANRRSLFFFKKKVLTVMGLHSVNTI